jgi:hypothetical protein
MFNSHSGMPMSGFGPLMFLLMAALVVVPFWRISTRAGYAGWFSLLVLVPVVNLVTLYFLAFADWPRLREATQ